MKKILTIGAVILAVIVITLIALGGYLFSQKDEIIRRGTEYGLSYVLEVPVTVGSASLEISAGTLQFTDINISNPDGYNSDHAMAFGLVKVQADVNSLINEQVKVINLVQVSQSDIILEKKGASSNLQDLMASSMRFASGEEATSAEEETSDVQMKIEKVIIDGTEVAAILPILNKEVGVKIPDIELNDFGGDKETVTPAEALQEFIAVILAEITKFGDGILPADFLSNISGDLKNLPGEILSNVTDQIGSITDSFKEMSLEGVRENVDQTMEDAKNTLNEGRESLNESVDDAKKSVDDAKDSIKGLFGGED